MPYTGPPRTATGEKTKGEKRMARTGLHHVFGYTELLTKEQIEKAKEGVFQVLERTGVTVKEARMRKELAAYGCQVDDAMERVRFGKEVIQKALQDYPGGFDVTARDPENNICFRPGQTTYFVNACGMRMVDLNTWTVRDPSRKEFYEHLRVIDALPNVDIQNCFPFFGFADVPECMRLLESTAAKFRVSTKAQIEGTVNDNYRFTTEMAKALNLDLFQIVTVISPLTFFEETADQIRTYAQADLPFHFTSGPTKGFTGPMTAVGTAVQYCAELVAGIVMAQMVKPGARVWANSMVMTPNMNNGNAVFGDVGTSLTDMVISQLLREFDIPSWSNAAAWTSSKKIDYQAGYEETMALMMQVIGGATVISFQGGLTAELTAHPVKAIIDDDIIGMVKRFMAGVSVDDDAFGIAEIMNVGPMPASFMETDLTLDYFREECYIPKVAGRETHEIWEQTGRPDILSRGQERMREILDSHRIVPLLPQQEQALEDILKDARTYYRKRGLISQDEWKCYERDLASGEYPFA